MGGVAAAVGAAISDTWHAVEKLADGVVGVVEDIGKFVGNVVVGIVGTAEHIVHGAVTGNWTEFRDGVIAGVTTAVAIIAIVSWGIVAGTIILDAQYNNGEALGRTISVAGDIETATLNTHYIETYAVEIQILITVAATLYAGYVAGPIINNWAGLSALALQWSYELDVLAGAYGSYQTYMAIQVIRDSQEYWKEKLREAEAYYRKLIAQAQAAKNLWFDMMTDPDMINRIQAGGDLFNLGAGHDLFSVTSVAEPRFALGLIDKSDPEMDRLINNRYFGQSAGSNGFKVN
jgi:hypothetical protein